jgi:glutathione peroxidase
MRTIFLVFSYFFSSLFINRNRPLDTNIMHEPPLNNTKSIYNYSATNIDGKNESLSIYKGKVLVIVNVASQCGNTPQYELIEKFYKQYKDKGVVVLGFPANNFGGQEPGSNKEIKQFCTLKYAVTFPMYGKISVKGSDKDPVYQFLTTKEKNGVEDSEVQWNFQKYVINKEGHLVGHFSPRMQVDDKGFISTIDALLK